MPFVMALFHTAGSASGRKPPDLLVAQRTEAQSAEIGLHVEQQTAAGYKVDQQDMVVKRFDGSNIGSVHRGLSFPGRKKIRRTLIVRRIAAKSH